MQADLGDEHTRFRAGCFHYCCATVGTDGLHWKFFDENIARGSDSSAFCCFRDDPHVTDADLQVEELPLRQLARKVWPARLKTTYMYCRWVRTSRTSFCNLGRAVRARGRDEQRSSLV